MVGLEENPNNCGSLNNPSGRLMRIQIHDPVPKTTLGRMALLQVSLSLLVERFRPGQHRYFDSIGTEILEILAAGGGCPDSREIRLAIRRLRRRGGQVR